MLGQIVLLNSLQFTCARMDITTTVFKLCLAYAPVMRRGSFTESKRLRVILPQTHLDILPFIKQGTPQQTPGDSRRPLGLAYALFLLPTWDF